jgi:toxin-antitoxin system PIN domain toxin
MVHLLDGNVLIALGDADHLHHDAARHWFRQRGEMPFATCPVTQGTLMRVLLHRQAAMADALAILHAFASHPAHRFWPDDLDYRAVQWDGVIGHRQVTDAYLAALARKHGGRLATLDRGLAALHHDVADLIPVNIPAKDTQ